MEATFTREQADIEASVRSIVKEEKATARDALAGGWSPPGCDAVLLADFGLLGVPESAGGMGSSLIDLLVAVEVLGERLVPSRFPAHAAAVQLAAGLGELPADVLDGRTVLTPAVDVPGAPGWPEPGTAEPGAAGTGAAGTLVRTLVPYAAEADAFAVLAADGVRIAPGEVTVRESFDPSVPLSDVVLPAGTSAPAAPGAGRAALVAAAELCGVAAGAIGLAAEHARTRTQFGRVIGSFQGVAFQLADAVKHRKAAWDLTLYAAWAVDRDRPEAADLVHAAKAAAGHAAVFAAERCVQVHGGMGITMEADPHLFLRRAHVLDARLGRGSWHRRRVGELQVRRRRGA
ncbi:hypothetical protein BJF79_00055 [Actinomadura sp. CNU-125]|uniref:acyl-CoA dehydrogenase n=1 Tax=Actinomadura sp. CNU-125 TaxID=1904961 RepID=UPI000964ECD6|nr:acyl-CoA dehydrogenase [Actinomadura sp. CNU-125]OLT31646.1 hypothetical protein BJF79_00055 [Actinomadura sp. CNU-125]